MAGFTLIDAGGNACGSSSSTTSTTSYPMSYSATITTGQHLFVVFGWTGTDVTLTCSDSYGNTFTEVGHYNDGNRGATVFYKFSATGGSGGACTITLSAARAPVGGQIRRFDATAPESRPLLNKTYSSGATSVSGYSLPAVNLPATCLVIVAGATSGNTLSTTYSDTAGSTFDGSGNTVSFQYAFARRSAAASADVVSATFSFSRAVAASLVVFEDPSPAASSGNFFLVL